MLTGSLSPTLVALFVFASAAATTTIAQIVKVLFLDPRHLDDTRRNTIMYVINYTINLALLMLIVVSQGAFVAGDIVFYLLLAGGQGVLSHAGFKILQSDARTSS